MDAQISPSLKHNFCIGSHRCVNFNAALDFSPCLYNVQTPGVMESTHQCAQGNTSVRSSQDSLETVPGICNSLCDHGSPEDHVLGEHDISDSEILERVVKATNSNTLKKRRWATNAFYKWLPTQEAAQRVLNKRLENYSVEDLNHFVCRFIIEAKNGKGIKFKAKTIFECVLSIQQFVNEQRSLLGLNEYHFLRDSQFYLIKKILDSEMKNRTKEGIYSAPRKRDYISNEMDDKLWELGI